MQFSNKHEIHIQRDCDKPYKLRGSFMQESDL